MKLQAPGSWVIYCECNCVGARTSDVSQARKLPQCLRPLLPVRLGRSSLLLIIKTFRAHFSLLQNKSGAALRDDAFTRNSHLYIVLLSVNLLMIFITRKESANQLLDNEAPLGSISKMRNCCRFKVWEGLSGS